MNVLSAVSAAKMEIIAEFEIGNAIEFGFKVRKSSSSNQETVIGYNVLNEELFVDRTKSNTVDFHSDFVAKHKAPMKPEHKRIQLSIYVDWSSVEIFGNNGTTIISDTIFPDFGSRGLELYSICGELKVVSLQINDLVSIWENQSV